jgi:DNA-binding response OmpR family regulator
VGVSASLASAHSPQHAWRSIGLLTVYFKEHRVTREKQELKFTPTGWKMFELLSRRKRHSYS